MTLNGSGITLKAGLLISILTLILGVSLFGVAQIQTKADKEEVVIAENRCIISDSAIRVELLDRIKELSKKQDETNILLMKLLLKEDRR